MPFFSVKILYPIPVSVKIQLAGIYVWFAMEDGVSVCETRLRNYVSPLITLIYGYGIMTMAVYSCTPTTQVK